MSALAHPGQWRLEHIELANWGTFGGLHSVDVPRKGFLLTGESGSGKSSLVDAISAVLTPRGKTRFNAAAADTGTRGSDRSVLTYVRGAWRRSADDETGEITSQYLRPKATWSGILLRYANGRGQRHTLVKLFHLKAGDNTPADVKDLSLLTDTNLSLKDLEPFAANGLKMRELKAAFPDATVDAEHSRFARRIARTLGLTGERAALLLHKTQSAKNLGSLDELFRKFMLDEPETFAKADAAVDQFTELNAAHAAVLRARRQVEHLAPLRDQDRDYAASSAEAERVGVLLDSLDDYTHARRRELTVQAVEEADQLAEKRERELRDAAEALHSAREHSENYRAAVQQQGGAQLTLIEAQLDSARRDLDRVQADGAELERKLGSVDLAMPADAAQYAELVRECTRLLEGSSAEQQLEQRASAATEDALRAREALAEIERDMQALRSSRSNLPRDLLAARALICQDTGLSADTLRFAGELLQVEQEHAAWTGAIERVLRPLALVMLVPAAHTLAVSRAVNARHLNASLKFETVSPQAPAQRRPSARNSLVYRVQVAQTPMQGWLQQRLAERYDYACVDDADQLAQVARGVTLAGQVKRGPTSFEKNDRHRVDDRRNWVLGFDTDAKLEQLQLDLKAAAAQLERCQNAERQAKGQLALLAKRRFVAEDLVRLPWEHVDVQRQHRRVTDLEGSRAELLADDGDLRAAQHQLERALEREAGAEAAHQAAQKAQLGAQGRLEDLRAALERLDELPAAPVPPATAAALHEVFDKVKTQRTTTHESIEADARKAQTALSKSKDELRNRMADLHQLMFQAISAFKRSWPEAAADLAESVDDRAGYLRLLGALEADRLPEFENRFFEMLRTQTQQNIAQLRELIQRAVREIRRRIEPINSSLLRSQYSPGRYLQIRVEDSRPAMAAEFLRDLNTVTTGALAPEEDRAEAEARFAVLARLMTQLGSSEAAHRSWRQQVLDVRNHVRFTAIEVDAEHQVLDVYDSGAGRSGGQKQKLVVFCLAAALRYQLAGESKLPSYASIVMDEAFDKADSNFTRTAMDIFTEFGFHMILATPMKLLRTLEDYVGGVALVTCEDSKASHIAQVPFAPADGEQEEEEPVPDPEATAVPEVLFDFDAAEGGSPA
ncbi:ATP-binding protein [Glutamicibacter protophormiae]|uniref:ATP-binding protein n=1 Tax=Glutamicibacter protophormiae TaxID=37930 RepID=UPI0033190567